MALLFIFLLLIVTPVTPEDDYDDDIFASLLNLEVSQTVQDRSKREHDDYRAAFISERLCEFDPHAWHCKKDCRSEHFRSETGLTGRCRKPSTEDSCFGMPITYPYVSSNISLPLQLSALQYYPSCWKRLAPLLCAYYYRPCGLFSYIRVSDETLQTKGDVELWARVRRGHCRNAEPVCLEAFHKNNITSTIFNCLDDDFYSEHCRMSDIPIARNLSSLIATPKCPPPLEFRENTHKGFPIISVYDSCYLPCRSRHLSDHDYTAVVYGKFIVAGIAALVFGSTSIYLCLFSDIYRTSIAVYSLTHSMCCITAYYCVWLISIIPSIAENIDCTPDGLRKTTAERRILDWCVSQSVLLHCSLTTSTLWICAFLYFYCCKGRRSTVNGLSPEGQKGIVINDESSLPLRPRAFFIIYFSGAFYSIFVMYADVRENDGMFGLCHVGLLSTFNFGLYLIAPQLLCIFVTSGMVWWIYRRSYDRRFKNGTKRTLEHMKDLEECAKERRVVAYRKKFNLPTDTCPTNEELQCLDEEELNYLENSLDIKKIQPEHVKYLSSAFIQQIHWSSTVPEDVKLTWEKKASRKVDGILSEFDKDETTKFIPRDELLDIGTRMLVGFPLERAHDHYSQRQDVMNIIWVVSMIVVSALSLLLSLGLHWMIVGRPENAERINIKEYIKCGMTRNFLYNSTDWIYNSNSLDGPFSSCILPDVIGGTRIEVGIFVFVFLPSLPHIIFVTSVVLGLAGYGGLLNARMLRPKGVGCCDLERATLEDDESKILIPNKGTPNKMIEAFSQVSSLENQHKYDSLNDDVDTEKTRFASTERLNKPVQVPSPPRSRCGSEPCEEKRKNGVRKLDLIGRMNEKRLQAREIRKLQLIEATKAAKLLEPSQREAPGYESDTSGAETGSSCGASAYHQLQDNVLTTASLISSLSTETDKTVLLTRMAQHIAFREGAMAERHQTVLNSMKRLLEHSLFNNAMSKSANNAVCLAEQLLHFVRVHLHNLLRCSDERRNSEEIRRGTEVLLRDVCALADAIRIHTPRMHEWADQNGETARYITAILQMFEQNQSAETSRMIEEYRPPVEVQDMNDKLDVIFEVLRDRLKNDANTKTQPVALVSSTTVNNSSTGPVALSASDGAQSTLTQKPADQQKNLSGLTFAPHPNASPSLNSHSNVPVIASSISGVKSSVGVDAANQQNNFSVIKFAPLKPRHTNGISQNVLASAVAPSSASNSSTPATGLNSTGSASVKLSPFASISNSLVINGPSATGDLPGPSGLVSSSRTADGEHPIRASNLASGSNISWSTSATHLLPAIQSQGSAFNSFPALNRNQCQYNGMAESVPVETAAPVAQASLRNEDIAGVNAENTRGEEAPPNARQVNNPAPQNQQPVDHGRNSALVLSPQTQTYSAAPHGLFTRLSDDALERRALRIQEFTAGPLYPQEIIYSMMLIGDVRYRPRNRQPETGESIIQHGSFERVFPVRGGVAIPLRYSPTTFLRIMRFRAVTLVTALGYHYMIMDGDTDPEYNPPVLPDLEMDVIHFDRMSLTRVIGGNAEGMTVVRRMQQIYRHGGRSIVWDPRNPFFSNFRKILDAFCELIGLELDREEVVPDPMPVAERNIFFEIREDEVITTQQLEELRLDMQLEDDAWENQRLQLGDVPNNERRLEDDYM